MNIDFNLLSCNLKKTNGNKSFFLQENLVVGSRRVELSVGI